MHPGLEFAFLVLHLTPDWFLKTVLSPCCSFAQKSTQRITQHGLSRYMLNLLISHSSSCLLNPKISSSRVRDWLAVHSACIHIRPSAQLDYTARPSLAGGWGHWNVGRNYVHHFQVWSVKTFPTQASMLSLLLLSLLKTCAGDGMSPDP